MPNRLSKKRSINTDVLTLSRQRVASAFDLFDTVAVSFSGGKDSTACLNLVLDEAKERKLKRLRVFFFDEEAIPYQTEEYVRRVAENPVVDLQWLCIPVRHRNGCSRQEPWWFPWDPDKRDKWVRSLPPEAITKLNGFPLLEKDRLTIPETIGLLFDPVKDGSVGMVMGIRADESITRTRAILSGRKRENVHIIPWTEGKAKNKNIFKVYPVYDWSTSDIWTAPKKYGWDYNHGYDVMTAAGIPYSRQRCAPPYGEEPMLALYQFAQCFPDIWGKMQSRVRGADAAARYARTVLYSYKSRPEKPDNISWEDFIKQWVLKHPQPYSSIIAKRISTEIQLHYSKTQEPIMQAIHPLTGMGWDFLLLIAVRGDLKGMKMAVAPLAISNDAFIKARQKYDAERAETRDKSNR